MNRSIAAKRVGSWRVAILAGGIYLLAATLAGVAVHAFLPRHAAEYGEWAFILVSAILFAWLMQGYLKMVQGRDQKLREVTRWLSVAGGEEVFDLLAQNLSRALETDGVLICELTGNGNGQLRSLAAVSHGRKLEGFECPWAGTPCEEVLRERRQVCHAGGGGKFFAAPCLPPELAAESFLGTPLFDSTGRAIGVMALLDRRPLCTREEVAELLPLFAVRAAGELERRRAEAELRDSEALLRTVFDQAFQLMGLMKPDGTLIKINRSAADSIRTDVDSVLDRPFWETPWWSHSAELQEQLRDAVRRAAEGEFVRFEATHPAPDGELVYVDFSIKPVLDDDGRVMLLVPEGRDITRHKRTEQALRLSEERFRSVFSTAAAGMVIISRDDRILDANPAFCQFTGYSEAELSAMTIEDVTHPEDRERTWQTYRELLAGKAENIHYEKRYLREDGRTVWGHASVACLIGAKGTAGYCIGLVQDITERKNAEEEVKALNATLEARAFELELSNRELEAFNYTVSHDLRKPLTVISGYCQVIQESCGVHLGEQCRSYLAEIFQGTHRMSELIDTLLNFASLTRAELQREHIDLSAVAQEIAAELRLTEPGRQAVFRITPGVMVEGDAKLLRVVLENLLGNAWKYTAGREEAIIEFGVTEVKGSRTCFVRDNGHGFDMADAERLFIPFQRLPGATEKVAGHGIGLATVQRIIARHGGCVWAEGEKGKGATFWFRL